MKHLDKRAGKRIHRGLFRHQDGTITNADVNGTLGMGRKCNGDAWMKSFWLVNKGVSPTPVSKLVWSQGKTTRNSLQKLEGMAFSHAQIPAKLVNLLTFIIL